MPSLLFPTRLLWGPITLLLPVYTQEKRVKQRHKDKLRGGKRGRQKYLGACLGLCSEVWNPSRRKSRAPIRVHYRLRFTARSDPSRFLNRKAILSPAARFQKYLPCVRAICFICNACEAKQLLITGIFFCICATKHLACMTAFTSLAWQGTELVFRV